MKCSILTSLTLSWLSVLAGCSDASEHDSTATESARGALVACRQEPDADGDDDCVGRAALTRKLDCEDVATFYQAVTLGCEPQDPGDPDDTDVCCPANVSGYRGSSGGSTESSTDLTGR